MTTEENKNEIEKEEVVPTAETETQDVTETPENTAETEAKTEEPVEEKTEVEATDEVVEAKAPAKKAKEEAEPASEAHDDFDWDMDNEGFTTYDPKEMSEMSKFYDQTFNNLEENQLVKGTIVSVNAKDVVVNVGFKSLK